MSSFAKFAGSKNGGTILLIGAGVAAAYLVYHLVKQVGSDVKAAAGQAISGATEVIGGITTGRNAVTAGTAYEGEGLAGTIGASFDAASGSHLSQIGDWIGGKFYDWFGDDGVADNSNSATGNPYSPTGPSGVYRQAANNSPTNAQYQASPLGQDGGGW